MAEVQIVLPKMGESVMEATVLRWLKQEGDEVAGIPRRNRRGKRLLAPGVLGGSGLRPPRMGGRCTVAQMQGS